MTAPRDRISTAAEHWLLSEAGATLYHGSFAHYGLELTSAAGPLLVHAHDRWLACMFVDVTRACEVFPALALEGRINAHSGKYNLHRPECADETEWLEAIAQHIHAVTQEPKA